MAYFPRIRGVKPTYILQSVFSLQKCGRLNSSGPCLRSKPPLFLLELRQPQSCDCGCLSSSCNLGLLSFSCYRDHGHLYFSCGRECSLSPFPAAVAVSLPPATVNTIEAASFPSGTVTAAVSVLPAVSAVTVSSGP